MNEGADLGVDAGGEGGAGGEGSGAAAAAGAAALVGGGASGDGGAGAGGEGGSGGGNEGAGSGSGGDPWFNTFSDQAPGEGKKSNREWLANKKYADPDSAITAFRDLEARFLAGDKLVVPKEGDPPEAFESFYKALGRPDAPDGYEVSAPEGHELDTQLLEGMRQAAFEAGVPKSAFEALAAKFNEYGLQLVGQESDARLAAKQQGTEELRRTWGDKFDANVADATRAMNMLELDGDTISGIEDGIGTVKTMDLLAKLGRGMSEDALIGGGTAKFSIGVADAQRELDEMKKGDKAEALMSGDKALKERREMLLQVVAQHEAAEAKRKQAS